MTPKQLLLLLLLTVVGCVPDVLRKDASTQLPDRFSTSTDTLTIGSMEWRSFYADSTLVRLIDSSLKNNKELNAVLQDVNVAHYQADARAGDVLPSVGLGVTSGMEKVGRYTRNGAVEDQLEVRPGERFPEPLGNYSVGATMTWEVDIWRKLRNATDAASLRYLRTAEGARYLATTIVSEIAASYYELMALDNLLLALEEMISIQKQALRIVEQQKAAARTTELAVKRFEAEVARNESRRYDVLQRIVEVENGINVLGGSYPKHVTRNAALFLALHPDTLHIGLPTQLLANRTDVRSAEAELKAAELDVDVARSRFYPTLNVLASLGFQAFNPRFIVTTPESMMYNLAGELMMPVINRASIKAEYYSAGARQVQAAYEYERAILVAYVEVANRIARLENYGGSLERKQRQVEALNASVGTATQLFSNARADYMEVLLTQRDALEARMDLIETKMNQMRAYVDLYRALGGGWK